MTDEQRATPSLLLALTPVVLTLLILGTQIFYFGVFEPHIPLAIGIALTSFVGTYLGLTWEEVRAGIFKVIHVALPSVSVLIVVGMIIGIWMPWYGTHHYLLQVKDPVSPITWPRVWLSVQSFQFLRLVGRRDAVEALVSVKDSNTGTGRRGNVSAPFPGRYRRCRMPNLAPAVPDRCAAYQRI